MPLKREIPVARGEERGGRPMLSCPDQGRKSAGKGSGCRAGGGCEPQSRNRSRLQPSGEGRLGRVFEPPLSERALRDRERRTDGRDADDRGHRDAAREARQTGRHREITDEELVVESDLARAARVTTFLYRASLAKFHRLDERPRWQRARIDEDALAFDEPEAKSRHTFGEWRRRGTIRGAILKAVPGTGDAAVEDSPLAQWAVLVLADIRDRREPAVVAEDRHALAGERHDAGAFLRDLADPADLDESVGGERSELAVERASLGRRREMQRDQPEHAAGEDREREKARIILERTQRHVPDEQRVGEVDAHVQPLPDRRREVREPEVVARRRHQEEDGERRRAELLERKLRDASPPPVARQQADERILVAQGVELEERQAPVDEGAEKHRDPEVAPIPQQRQKPPVEPRERPDGEHDVQESDRERAESTDHQGFGGPFGTRGERGAGEYREVENYGAENHGVVALLARRPADGEVAGAHLGDVAASSDADASRASAGGRSCRGTARR